MYPCIYRIGFRICFFSTRCISCPISFIFDRLIVVFKLWIRTAKWVLTPYLMEFPGPALACWDPGLKFENPWLSLASELSNVKSTTELYPCSFKWLEHKNATFFYIKEQSIRTNMLYIIQRWYRGKLVFPQG